jgi:hypothetical protein
MYVMLYMSCFLNSQQLARQTILHPVTRMTYNVENCREVCVYQSINSHE